MKLHIENIGKIKSADVVLDGITVIAGKNNTGKSTVGKTLYCIFNSLYNIDKKIERDKRDYIRNAVLSPLGVETSFFFIDGTIFQYVDKIIQEIKLGNLDAAKKLYAKLKHFFEDDTPYNSIDDVETILDSSDIDDDVIIEIEKKVNEAFSIPDQVFYTHIANNIFNSEFSNQIINFNAETGRAILNIQQKDIIIEIGNKSVKSNSFMKLHSDIIYIESPFILDNINYLYSQDILPYRYDTVYKLAYNNRQNMTSELIIQNKLENIFNLLSDIGIGELYKETTDIGRDIFKYKEENNDNKIEISNISAGIKTFIILKTLILNGQIADKGCIILDEPEVHLHPEWQLVFARLIVLLQKTFNLHILLNTHSPYFLRAIQVYSSKYEIADRCNYYLAENNEDGTASIRDIKGSIEEIYKLLHRPFQDLENE